MTEKAKEERKYFYLQYEKEFGAPYFVKNGYLEAGIFGRIPFEVYETNALTDYFLWQRGQHWKNPDGSWRDRLIAENGLTVAMFNTKIHFMVDVLEINKDPHWINKHKWGKLGETFREELAWKPERKRGGFSSSSEIIGEILKGRRPAGKDKRNESRGKR